MSEHPDDAVSSIEQRLRSARPSRPEVSTGRLDSIIAAGKAECAASTPDAVGGDDPAPTVPERVVVDLERPDGRQRRPRMRRIVALGSIAASLILAALIVGADPRPDTEADLATAPIEIDATNADEPAGPPAPANGPGAVPSLAVAWLGVAPDESTPERAVIGGHRLVMSEDGVELIWAELDPSDGDPVVHELRRIRVASGRDPSDLMTDDAFAAGDLRYRGAEHRYVDTDVTPGAEYVFGIRASSGDEVGPVTWRSDVFAITDLDPPASVADVAIETEAPTEAGVRLSWSPWSSPDTRTVQVHRRGDADESERIAVAYNDDGVDLADVDVGSGDELLLVTVDRHGNASAPVAFTVPG